MGITESVRACVINSNEIAAIEQSIESKIIGSKISKIP